MEFKGILLFLGFISLSKSTLSFSKWIYANFFRRPKNLKEYGSWALITGATDGIGRALAFEFASKGLNLILAGRNPSKLESTVSGIRAKNGEKISIKTIVIDFQSDVQKIGKQIEEAIDGLDVGILVNNAGCVNPYAKFVHEMDKETIESMIKVNMEALTWVTRTVLPKMLEKKKGAIVNLGSGSAGVVPSYPLYTIYAASKAYVKLFSKCLSVEYKQQGIDVQCQLPLFVQTKMATIQSPASLFMPSPETFSKSSIKWIGYDEACLPYWPHAIQGWFFHSVLPAKFVDRYLLTSFLKLRKEGKDA